MKVIEILDFEVRIKDNFECMNSINIISKDDQVININEKDDGLVSMEFGEERMIRGWLLVVQGNKQWIKFWEPLSAGLFKTILGILKFANKVKIWGD